MSESVIPAYTKYYITTLIFASTPKSIALENILVGHTHLKLR